MSLTNTTVTYVSMTMCLSAIRQPLFAIIIACYFTAIAQSQAVIVPETKRADQKADTLASEPNEDTYSDSVWYDTGQNDGRRRLLAFANNSPLAVAEHSGKHFEVINLRTGQVARILTGTQRRGGGGALSSDRHSLFSLDDKTVWTLNSDQELVFSLEEWKIARQRNKQPLTFEATHSKEAASQSDGSHLVGWSLDTGEVTKELVVPERSILLFDLCQRGDRTYIATLEGKQVAWKEYLVDRLFVAIYDAATLKKLDEIPWPNERTRWYDSYGWDLKWVKKGAAILISKSQAGQKPVTLFNVSPKLSVSWQLQEDYKTNEGWRTQDCMIFPDQIVRFQVSTTSGVKKLRLQTRISFITSCTR